MTTGQDGSVVLRDGVTGQLLGSVLLPDKVTSRAAFGADQNTVVIASNNDGLDYWETRTTQASSFACRPAVT